MTKPRPTEAEFEELKRKRDKALADVVSRVCKEQGWEEKKVHVHASGAGDCYCACPDGPCQHVWDGPDLDSGSVISATCSRCGLSAFSHDMRCAP